MCYNVQSRFNHKDMIHIPFMHEGSNPQSAFDQYSLTIVLVVLENPCSWLFLRTPRACVNYEGTCSNEVRKSLKRHGSLVKVADWSSSFSQASMLRERGLHPMQSSNMNKRERLFYALFMGRRLTARRMECG
jgi:hypothetical protein